MQRGTIRVGEGREGSKLVEVTIQVNMCHNSRKYTGKMCVSCKEGVLMVDFDYDSDTFALEIFG